MSPSNERTIEPMIGPRIGPRIEPTIFEVGRPKRSRLRFRPSDIGFGDILFRSRACVLGMLRLALGGCVFRR